MRKATKRDRKRALLLALVATLVCLVIVKFFVGLFWYSAFLLALVVFGFAFAFFLRAQRNTFQ